MNKSFDTDTTFARFKEVDKVMGNSGIIFKTVIENDCVCFFEGKKCVNVIHKNNLYERWLTIDGILHYIQRVNHWMGSTQQNYIKAEL